MSKNKDKKKTGRGKIKVKAKEFAAFNAMMASADETLEKLNKLPKCKPIVILKKETVFS